MLPGAPGNEALLKHSCALYQQDDGRPHADAAPGETRRPEGRRGQRAAGRCYPRRTSTTASSSRPAPGSRPSTSARTTRLDTLGWRTTWPTLTPTHCGRSCTSSLPLGETPTASRPSCCTAMLQAERMRGHRRCRSNVSHRFTSLMRGAAVYAACNGVYEDARMSMP